MNLSTMHGRVLRVLNTNATAYPKATTFTDDLGEAYQLRVMDILRLKNYKEITSTQAYSDIVASSGLSEGALGYNGEYPLPTDVLDITRIEINRKIYTNDVDDWVSIDKDDLYDIRQSSESELSHIVDHFTNTDPQIRIDRGSIFIRPLPIYAVTSGYRVFYKPRQDALSGDSATPTFESNLHQILLYDCAELEMLSHPESYSTEKKRLIRNKRREVESAFEEYYKTKLKPAEKVEATNENFK